MKNLLIILAVFAGGNTWSQTVNYERLTGIWHLGHATYGISDITFVHQGLTITICPDSSYVSEKIALDIQDSIRVIKITGTYSLIKSSRKITFTNNTTTVTMIGKDGGRKEDLIKDGRDSHMRIISLDYQNNLVILSKGDIEQDEPSDTMLFFTKKSEL